MYRYHKNSVIDKGISTEDLAVRKTSEYDIIEDDYSDENTEDYNEEIYKWLSVGVLIIWFFSMLYL